MMRMELKGGAELRRKLLAMEKGLAADFLMPIVDAGAQDLRAAEASLAPKLTGAGAASISVEHIKAGKGYAYTLIGPDAEHYYMQFQEYGLGTGRSVPVQEKTRRRRGNYEQSYKIHRQLLDRSILASDLHKYRFNRDLDVNTGLGLGAGELWLSRRELKRQYILAMGGYLQGLRRPNMAAHPFARPAVIWRWPYIRQLITDKLRALVERLGGSP